MLQSLSLEHTRSVPADALMLSAFAAFAVPPQDAEPGEELPYTAKAATPR